MIKPSHGTLRNFVFVTLTLIPPLFLLRTLRLAFLGRALVFLGGLTSEELGKGGGEGQPH